MRIKGSREWEGGGKVVGEREERGTRGGARRTEGGELGEPGAHGSFDVLDKGKHIHTSPCMFGSHLINKF